MYVSLLYTEHYSLSMLPALIFSIISIINRVMYLSRQYLSVTNNENIGKDNVAQNGQ